MNLPTLSRRAACAALVVSLAAGTAAHAADKALSAAVSGPLRSEANVARDDTRHPGQSLAFWGLKPGATVIEINPGAGYWTEILAPYAKATGGHYIATGASLSDPNAIQAAKDSRQRFEAKFSDADKWGKVQVVDFSDKPTPLAAPGTADLIITARNIHNWLWSPGRVDTVFAQAYAALKPGGILAVEEHRADPRPQNGDARDGYVAEATVIAAAQKAGFKLDARSDINANPKDTKDHPFGVWTLPPVLRSAPQGKPADPTFDQTKYKAIGESDRMTLRFRKPA